MLNTYTDRVWEKCCRIILQVVDIHSSSFPSFILNGWLFKTLLMLALHKFPYKFAKGSVDF